MFKITNVRNKRVPVEKVVRLSQSLGWDDPVLGQDLWYTGKNTDIHTKDIVDSNPSWELTAEQLLQLINYDEYSFNAAEMFDLDLPEEKKTLITDVSMKETPDMKVALVEHGWEMPELGKDKKFWYITPDELTETDKDRGIISENPVLEANTKDLQHLSEHFDFNIIDKNINGEIDQPELEPASDMVNHPSHYADTDLPAEVIDIIEPTIKNYPSEVGYHVGNVIKYLLRAPYKNNLKEDVEKAEFYLKRTKDILEDK